MIRNRLTVILLAVLALLVVGLGTAGIVSICVGQNRAVTATGEKIASLELIEESLVVDKDRESHPYELEDPVEPGEMETGYAPETMEEGMGEGEPFTDPIVPTNPTATPTPTKRPEEMPKPTPSEPIPTPIPKPTATPYVFPKSPALSWPSSIYDDDQILLVLDAGHGGTDSGTLSKDKKTYEKDINLALVLKMKPLLEEKGITVVLSRSEDTFVSLEDRVALANGMATDLFVSIHVNSYDKSSKVSGLECYYYPGSVPCSTLAGDVVSHLKNNTSIKVRGVREGKYHVLADTSCTAILVETGYITNASDLANLTSDSYQDTLAQSLVDAITKSMGK